MASQVLPGQRFGLLTAVVRSKFPPRPRDAYWDCDCDCGATCQAAAWALRNGTKTSCGCKWRAHLASGRAHLKHGSARHKAHTTEYNIWSAMKERCSNINCAAWKHYGGRGISVCLQWHDFAVFLKDMGLRPSNLYSIDRINNDGNYEPGNCRWATKREQMLNRREFTSAPRKLIEFRGEALGIAQWARKLGWPKQMIGTRLRRGWSIERALTTPP